MITIIFIAIAALCIALGFLMKLTREYKFRGHMLKLLEKQNAELRENSNKMRQYCADLRQENDALKRELKEKEK